jgi:hypothetical protein
LPYRFYFYSFLFSKKQRAAGPFTLVIQLKHWCIFLTFFTPYSAVFTIVPLVQRCLELRDEVKLENGFFTLVVSLRRCRSTGDPVRQGND